MTTPLYSGAIPSKRQALLKQLEGQRIKQLIRYSEYSIDHLQREYELCPEDYFSLTIGPFAICLESGLKLGIYEDIDLNSIMVCVERNEAGQKAADAFEDEKELFPIDGTSAHAASFWHNILGQRIRKVEIIRRKPVSVRYEDLPNEIALLITLDSGDAFTPTRGMYKGLFDFYVIPKQDVDPDIIPELIDWQ